MRRFELIEGSSSKFWEVECHDEQLTVRYGRIGSAGQTQTKTYASAAKAQAEHDKLVREKTGKGYQEVGVSAAAALAPVAPKPVAVSAPVAPPAAVPEAPVPAVINDLPAATQEPMPTAPPAAGTPEPQPPGQFLWTPHWRKLMPAWRGEPQKAPEPIDAAAELRQVIEGAKAHARRTRGLNNAATQRLLKSLGMQLDSEDLDADETLLLAPDRERWTHCMRWVLSMGHISYGDQQPIAASQVWRAAAGRFGLPFALDILLSAVSASDANTGNWWMLSNQGEVAELRARIAASAEPEYAELLALARQRAPESDRLACVVAYLFPTEAERVSAAIAALQAPGNGMAGDVHWLATCVLNADQAAAVWALMDVQPWFFGDHLRVATLNLVRLGLPQSLRYTQVLLQRPLLSTEHRRQLLDVVRAHDSVEALGALLQQLDDKDARPLADAFARQWPELALRLAGSQLLEQRSNKSLGSWLERHAAAHADALAAARARADGGLRALLDGLAARQQTAAPEVAVETLPDWLRNPPWRQRARRAAPSYPTLVPLDVVPCMVWADGERERWMGRANPDPGDLHHDLRGLSGEKLLRRALGLAGVRSSSHTKVMEVGAVSSADLESSRWAMPSVLLALPPMLAAAVLATRDPREWYEWGEHPLEMAVARMDALGLPAIEHFAAHVVERGLELALPAASPRIAPIAATALRSSKKAKAPAQAWLLRHASLATVVLLPLLTDRKHGEDASHALRWLLANGRGEAVEAGAARYGEDGTQALATLRDFDPMQLAPTRAPKLPDFWLPTGYTRIQLRSGGSLPLAVMDAVGEMLAFSALDQPYAGVEQLRALCTPASLGAFAWDLFQSWLVAGAPSKESWAYTALGQLGDDEAARQLALLIRLWPGEGAHARAVTGLDVLAAIGSDVALMHLNGIAQKVKFKGLQEKARAKIALLAEARGLSSEELADRLVPDLGLDDAGTLTLDFGPRQFSVGFDETLKPFVRDASGARLKDLPKPIKSDDAARAEEAQERYKALKKDARTLASQQILRMELAMVEGRRWRAREFRALFVEHPLLRHLSRRLLWGHYEDGVLVQCLRVAEDLSYADAHDDLLTLPDEAMVGLVHPLQLSAADAAAFGQIYADYEILQPFPQLGRECHRLSPDEQAAWELTRYRGKQVATGSVFGLEHRLWRRGEPQDGGWIGWFTRRVSSELEVHLDLDPGTVVGDIQYEPKQTLGALELRRPHSWGEQGRRRWGELDPVLASEILRDIERLAVWAG